MGNNLKIVIYFGIFALLTAIHLSVFITDSIDSDKNTSTIVKMVISVASLIQADVSSGNLITFKQEITPAVLAVIIASTIPSGNRSRLMPFAIVVASATYFLYLHFSIFINSGDFAAVIRTNIPEPDNPVQLFESFVAGARTFSLVTAASLIGLNISVLIGKKDK